MPVTPNSKLSPSSTVVALMLSMMLYGDGYIR